MAKTIDDLYDLFERYLQNNGQNNGGGNAGVFSGGGNSRGFSSKKMDADELDKTFEKYRDKLDKVGQKKVEYNLSETEKYLKLQKEIEEREERISELYDEINDSLDRRNELLEKREDGTITEDELDELDQYNEKIDEANTKMEEHVRLKEKAGNTSLAGSMMSDLSGLMGGFKKMYNAVNDLTKPYQKVDAAASKYAKTLGMTKAGMESLAKTSLSNVSSKLAAEYNVSTAELLEAQSNYMKATGRNIRVDSNDQESMAAMKAMGGNGNELAALYDNFGVSMESTADHVGKMFSDASKQGLSFEKYSDNVAKNIKIAQNYTFKNGLKGLESMAKKATAMKMDMQQVAALADKVSTVEGAIDVSSQLQVLGGPFAQLADPLGMLNEGLNDMEGLQDRLIKMVGGLGSFDKETGEVKVSSFNKQRIKAASQAMGVDYGTIMESVNAQARRGEISKQIAASETASGFDDDMKELIMNSGTIKDGKAGVSINGKFKSVDELTANDYEALQAESRTETEDIKVMAKSLQSIEEKIEGFEKAKEAKQAEMYQGIAEKFGEANKWLSRMDTILTILSVIQGVVAAGQVLGGLGDIFKGGKGIVKGVFNGVKNIGKKIFGGGGSSAGGSANTIMGKVQNFGKKIFGGGSAGGSANTIGGKGGSTISKAWNSVKNIFSGGGSTAGGSASTIGGKGSLIDDLFTKGKNFFSGSFKQGSGILNNIMKSGKGFITKILGSGKGILGSLLGKGKGLISNLMKNGNGLISNLLSKGKGLISNLLSSGKSLLSNLFSGGGGGGGNLLSRAFNGVKNLFKRGKGGRIANLASKAWNGVKNVGSKIFGKGGSSIIKGGLGQTAKRAGLKVFGKTAMKGAAKIGGKLLAGVAKGGPLGIVGAIGDAATDALVASGKIKKGGVAHNVLSAGSGAASGAAMGAMIGSVIPGVGTLIGGAIGGIVGGIKGLVKAGGLKKIGNAISKAWKRSPAGRAVSAVGKLFGIGKKKKIKKFEAKSKKSAEEILKGYSSRVKPVLEKGANSTYGGVNKANNDIHLKSDPHDVKINGTLNLRGQDGKTIDIVSELRNNPHMLRQVSDMISNEMGVLQKGVNVVQRA